MSIYGPPVGGGGSGAPSPVPGPTGMNGFSGSSSPMMMPQPTIPIYGDDEDGGVDRFDPKTEENTRLNAVAGNGVVDVPSSSVPVKKNKKKKR